MSNQPKSLSVRAQLCQQIMEDLFKADKARLQRRLSRALAEVEGEASNSAFHYKGKTFFVTGLPAVRGAHVIDVPRLSSRSWRATWKTRTKWNVMKPSSNNWWLPCCTSVKTSRTSVMPCLMPLFLRTSWRRKNAHVLPATHFRLTPACCGSSRSMKT